MCQINRDLMRRVMQEMCDAGQKYTASYLQDMVADGEYPIMVQRPTPSNGMRWFVFTGSDAIGQRTTSKQFFL